MRSLQIILWWALGLLLALGLWAWAVGAHADAAAVVDEAEREGIDMLYAALAAAVTALVGWIVKSPRDYIRERRAAQNGSQALPGASSPAVGQMAYDALTAHEVACDERYNRIHERIDGVDAKMTQALESLGYIRGWIDAQKEKPK